MTEAGVAPSAPPAVWPTIEVTHASKWFRDLVAISDVSFSIGPGVTALLGSNGAGIMHNLIPATQIVMNRRRH